MIISRITASRIVLAALFILLLPPFGEAATAVEPVNPLEKSHYHYTISFLWFDRLAEGGLSLTPAAVPGQYQVVLEARTLGVAAWLTGQRAHRYVSLMETLPDGQLRTLRFESHVLKGAGKRLRDRAKEYVFNYAERRVDYRRAKDGHFGGFEEIAMGDVALNDFLTVFTSFRLGHYDSPPADETLTLATFEQGHPAKILVTRVSLIPEKHRKLFPATGRLFQINMGKDILDTGGGKVFLWFDERDRPARVVVENVIGLGDVAAVLSEVPTLN